MTRILDATTPEKSIIKEMARNKVTIEMGPGDLLDKASDIWLALHPNFEDADFYPCKLCGATMYASMDYTHEDDCPYVAFEAAAQAFGKAIQRASQPDGEA